MARNDWIAVVTKPAAEYVAMTELERFGLHPYLPQARRRWLSPCTTSYRARRYPLFPRYLLLPIADADPTAIRAARGISPIHPILAAEDGVLWRAPDRVVYEIHTAEARGDFDEVLTPGSSVRLNGTPLAGVAVTLERAMPNLVELFAPLLGGVRIKVSPARVVRV